MITLARSIRFDDVDDEGRYSYHGTNHDLQGMRALYKVRCYEDEPGVATVISPANARTMGEARELVDYLCANLGVNVVKFYCGRAEGGQYVFVDLESLEFKR